MTDAAYANTFLFYVDQLHLTSAGFAIVAQYIDAQLAAPLTLQAPSDLGHDTARQFGRTLSSRADLAARAGSPGVRFFAVGDGFSREVDESMGNNAFDIDGAGATAGVEVGLAAGVAGIAANYSRPRVRFGDQSARINGHSWQLGGYAGASFGGAFAQGHVGIGRDKHRIRRAGVVDAMTARPSGDHLTAGAKAGFLMPFGLFRAGPVAALDYTRAKVDGYTEDGDPALTLDVGSQKLTSLTGQLGIELRADVGAAGAGIRPYAMAAVEKDFEGDGRRISFAQTSSPIIVNSWDIRRSKGAYARIAGGASADLFSAASLNAAVSATIGQDSGDEIGAQVGFKVGF